MVQGMGSEKLWRNEKMSPAVSEEGRQVLSERRIVNVKSSTLGIR